MPRGNPSPKLAITVDADIHENILSAAARDGVSVSAWMTTAAREALYPEFEKHVRPAGVEPFFFDPRLLKKVSGKTYANEGYSNHTMKGQVEEALRRKRRVPHNAADDFEITSPDFLSSLWNQLTGAMVLLSCIGGVIGFWWGR